MPDDHFKASRLTEEGLDAFRDLVDKSRSGVLDQRPSVDRERRRILNSRACFRTINNAPKVDGFTTLTTRQLKNATTNNTVAAAAGDSTERPRAAFMAASTGMPMPANTIMNAYCAILRSP